MFKFQVLRQDEIPLDNIRPNRHNPRPTGHFVEEYLAGLANSINLEGQHLPAVVYELVPDEPGQFMLLQGERRWRACKMAPNVDTLVCNIVARPKALAEELTWLGVEGSFKEEWGHYALLELAHKLAKELGVSMNNAEVRNKLGLTANDCRIGERLFSLEPPIIDMVRKYEAAVYRQRHTEGKGGRIRGVKNQEFSHTKAALVWDLFTLVRQSSLSKLYPGNLELQERLATIASRTAIRNLENFVTSIRDHVRNPSNAIDLKFSTILANPARKGQIEDFVRQAGKTNVVDVNKLLSRCNELLAVARTVGDNPDQLGADIKLLYRTTNAVRGAIAELQRTDRKLEKSIRVLEYMEQD